MPLPNTNTNGDNYSDFTQGYETVNQYIGRIDHKFNDKNQFNIHYIYALRHNPALRLTRTSKPTAALSHKMRACNTCISSLRSWSNELRMGTEIDDGKSRN